MASAVEGSSLRVVARQVGMSGATLSRFLDGGAPTPPAFRKLHRWFARRPEAGEMPEAAPRARTPAEPADEDVWTEDPPPRIELRYSPGDVEE